MANGVPYGLSASVYTRNVNAAFAALRDLYTGIVYINAPTSGRKRICPSAAPSKPATATAKPPSPPSISSPNGNPSTSTIRTNSNAPKSTTTKSTLPLYFMLECKAWLKLKCRPKASCHPLTSASSVGPKAWGQTPWWFKRRTIDYVAETEVVRGLLEGLGRGLYPEDYLEKERDSWA